MSTVDEILRLVPMDQLASELRLDPNTTRQLAAQATSVLISGMSANAADESGARSLAQAMDAHAADPLPSDLDLGQVDTSDGQAIVQHIFGNNTDQVIQTLGAKSPYGSSDLVNKLLPILAPIVLAYLSKKLASGKYGDILGPILESATGGATRQQAPQSGGLAGTLLNEVLDQMLGGGRQAQPAPQQAPAPQAPAQQAPAQPGMNAPDRMDVGEAPAPQTTAGSQAAADPVMDLLKDLLGGGRRA